MGFRGSPKGMVFSGYAFFSFSTLEVVIDIVSQRLKPNIFGV